MTKINNPTTEQLEKFSLKEKLNSNLVLVILGVAILAIGGLAYYRTQVLPKRRVQMSQEKVAQLKATQEKVRRQGEAVKRPTPTPWEIPFDYEVLRVEEKKIVLDGEHGEMSLTTNPTQLHVFMGAKEDNPQAVTVETIKPGMKAQLVTIPGQEFWLYLKK